MADEERKEPNGGAEFDPYLEWLDIPPDRRPMTPYILLGIDPGERDMAKIEEAAHERRSRVWMYRTSPDEQISRLACQLAQEIAGAVAELRGKLTSPKPENKSQPVPTKTLPPPLPDRPVTATLAKPDTAPVSDTTPTAGSGADTVVPPQDQGPESMIEHVPALPRVLSLLGRLIYLAAVEPIPIGALARRGSTLIPRLIYRGFLRVFGEGTEIAAGFFSVLTLALLVLLAGLGAWRLVAGLGGTHHPVKVKKLPLLPIADREKELRLLPIADREVVAGATVNVRASVADVEHWKAVGLRYRLEGGPPGASIDASMGGFSWTPPEHQPPGPHSVTVVVESQGQRDQRSFTINVLPRPEAPGAIPRVLTGSRDNTARLWDAATGRELRRFEGHTNDVNSVSFSPDGRRVLTGSWDNTARLWDAATGRELRRFEGHTGSVNSVSFSPDGRRVLTGSGDLFSNDNTARLWDAATGQELRRFEGHTGWVWSVSFSPDGRRVLTGSGDLFSNDNTARLWDAATGQELRRFEGHTWPVSSVSFSPDGTRAPTGSSMIKLRLLPIADREVVAGATVNVQASVADYPAVADYQYELISAYAWVPVSLFPWQGRFGFFAGDEADLRNAMAVAEQLTRQYPTVPQYARSQVVVLAKLATLCCRRGRLAEAEKLFAEALAKQSAQVGRCPEPAPQETVFREFLRMRQGQVCYERYKSGQTADLATARRLLEECIESLGPLCRSPEFAPERLARNTLATAYQTLSELLAMSGQTEAAETARRKARALQFTSPPVALVR
jgi:hypothetical protein